MPGMPATHGKAMALGTPMMAKRKREDMLDISVVELGLNMMWSRLKDGE